MAHPRRTLAARLPDLFHAPPLRPSDGAVDREDYRRDDAVGLMQIDLARRLAYGTALTRGERAERFLSVAAGYTALLAGYAGAALLVLR